MWGEVDHERFFSDPSRQPPRTGLVIVVSALVSAATAAVLYFTLGGAGDQRPVPALVGMPLHEALTLARDRGVRLVVSGSTPDPLVTKGAVASQSPLAGSLLPAGAPVRVVLSDGLTAPQGRPLGAADAGVGATPARPPPARAQHKRPKPRDPDPTASSKGAVPAPRLIGLRLADAKRRLHRTGLTVGRVSLGTDEDRMDGRVLRQTPAPGARVNLGGSVSLVVNNTSGM